MSMIIGDGGPAFPVELSYAEDGQIYGAQTGSRSGWHTGLSIRDYFAAAAIPWALQNVDVSQPWKHSAAMAAYEIADAMLAAREGKAAS